MYKLSPLAPQSRISHIHPGEVLVAGEGTTISTLLGSCVCVCLWDRIRLVGGMNHVMLPRTYDKETCSTRYGNIATFVLLDMLNQAGSERTGLRASVFGGARDIAGSPVSSGKVHINIGEQNVAVTLKVLRKLNIPVIKKSVGGHRGRKITFDVSTGKVECAYIKKSFDSLRV